MITLVLPEKASGPCASAARCLRGQVLEARHDWSALADRTLALAEEAHRCQPTPRALATRSPPP